MKKTTVMAAAIFLSVFTLLKCASPESANVRLPQDVLQSCTVSKDSFNNWFASKEVTLNGMVTPANSVDLVHNHNCDFYKWSERMFLWITSMNNGDTVLASSMFYNVSSPDSSGNRVLTANTPGRPMLMSSHIDKFGPNRLPVLMDNKGKLFEIEKVKNMVMDASGKEVTVDHIEAKGNHVFALIDTAGKVIDHPRPFIKNTSANIVREMGIVNGKKIFLTGNNKIVESEEGQATGDGLMAQNGSLVYYLTSVNDVYAAYLSMVKTTNSSLGKQFPSSHQELDSITAFARGYNKHNPDKLLLPDSNALAIEVKSSWIEASSLPNPKDYITVKGTITTYDTSNKNKWIPNGTKTVDMAMVGMHIVGSVAAHPEMVWATFEHQNNTPNAAYRYMDTSKKVKTVPQEKRTGWLLAGNNADTSYNKPHITSRDKLIDKPRNTDTLFSANGFAISASNTLRTMPWGSAINSSTNGEDGSDAASNSEIISINNSIHSMLAKADRRRNYLFIGAIWTENGAAPNGSCYGVDTLPGVAIGTSRLANSTMETYFQSSNYSCFTCHSANNHELPVLTPDSISHIFSYLKPLATGFAIKK